MIRRLARAAGAARVLVLGLLLAACGGGDRSQRLLDLPISGPDAVPAEGGAVFDSEVTSDGNGSLRIEAADTTTVFLYDAGALEIEDATLLYQAEMRSEDLDGSAYLEMRLLLPRGEYLTRSAASPLSGTTGWERRRTGYVLREDEAPQRVRLYVTIHGRGTVWIDDISLIRQPRP